MLNYALKLYGVGDLRLEQTEMPRLSKGNVLVEVMACGICSSDKSRLFVSGTYHYPTVVGHEFSGRVVQVYDKKNASYLGKRVAIFPMLPCFECEECKKENYALCSHYNYFGSRCDGGFQRYIEVPVWNLVLCSDEVDYKLAALCEPTAVAISAAARGGYYEHSSVAVHGSGTIGYLLSVYLESHGCDATMIGRRASSCALCEGLGIDTIVLNEDNEKDFYGKYDLIFELVGSIESFKRCLNLASPGGTVVLVGNPEYGFEVDRTTYWSILRKQLILKGAWNSRYGSEENDWHEAAEFISKNKNALKKLITRTYRLKDYKEAFEFFISGNQKTKVMFDMEGEEW